MVKFGTSETSSRLKSLLLKWKSRSPPPTRLIDGDIECGRIQPIEGCVHGMIIGTDGWIPVIALYTQLMAYMGDFPDRNFDPEIRLRVCIRDSEVVSGDYRVTIPNCILTRSIKRGGFADLLSGFQTLSNIPSCHFEALFAEDTTRNIMNNNDKESFPYNGAFCSCICGQERTSWSWALPNIISSSTSSGDNGVLPVRIKLPGRILGNSGLVCESTWKQAQKNEFVHVPTLEYAGLLEAKLKMAEQQLTIDQLREQYNLVMEEMTKKNIFLKEKWAEEAVQMGGKDTVIDILTQKVCVMEKLVRELTDACNLAERATVEIRQVCANELAFSRKELLEETQRLKYRIADTKMVEQGLVDDLKEKDRELDLIRKQREFLLGIGAKLTLSIGVQVEPQQRN